MSEWSEKKLTDIIDIIKDQFRPDINSKFKYIGLEHIEQEKLRLKSNGYSSEVISNKFIFNKDDILFGKLRPYFRKVVKAKFRGVCSTDIWVIRSKENFSQDFVFYFLANWDFINTADIGEGGSRMPRADWNFLKNKVWMIPPLPEQKAIASILSSLDDKIDLLHRQNKTLEAISEILFRQWFVEEAQEDWEEKTLDQYGDVICGKTPSKKEQKFFGGETPFIKIPDMHDSVFILNTADSLTEEGKLSQKNKTLPAGSICVSCIATVGLVSITSKHSQTNQQINSIVPYKEEFRYFLYLFMKYCYDLLHAMASGGTATLNLNTGNFSNIIVPFPGNAVLKNFHLITSPIFNKLHQNLEQIRTLEKLRDTLLPKLMSGEVRVAA